MSDLTLDALRAMVRADIVSYAAATRASATQFAGQHGAREQKQGAAQSARPDQGRAPSRVAANVTQSPSEADFFLDQLLADAHCTQGLLVLIGYWLCARRGQAADEQPAKIPPAIITAARAVQMTHVYAEQIFGASELNTPVSLQSTAPAQTPERPRSLSLHAGLHAAEILLANLDVPAELRLRAVSITNRALLVRAHGQAAQYAARELTEAEQNMFATELTLNPLHVGMVLADADCAATDAITPFALELGRAMLARDRMPKVSTIWLHEARHVPAWNRAAIDLLEQFANSLARS